MLKKVFFTTEYNEWYLEELHRQESGHYIPDLAAAPMKIRLFWRFQFKGFFIHIGKGLK